MTTAVLDRIDRISPFVCHLKRFNQTDCDDVVHQILKMSTNNDSIFVSIGSMISSKFKEPLNKP